MENKNDTQKARQVVLEEKEKAGTITGVEKNELVELRKIEE